MQPSDIRFTESSIFTRFSVNGEPVYLEETFRELLNGSCTVDGIAYIEVVFVNGLWWVLYGNKRLFLYKKLQRLGIVTTIPVIVQPWGSFQVQERFGKRYTTQCNGLHIQCVEKKEVRTSAVERIRSMIGSWCQKRCLNPNYYLTSDDY